MTLNHWLHHAISVLAAYSDSAAFDAALLAEHITQLTPTQQRYHNPTLTPEIYAALEQLLTRRANGEPIAYILGHQPFYDLDLRVTPDTLIPRPDTECLLEAALEKIPQHSPHNIADLGTGSGALAIAIGKHRPHTTVFATDYALNALIVAQDNAKRHNVQNVHFLQSDWLSVFAPQSLDIIVSNPPYIDPDDPHLPALCYEPITALTAADNGFADLHSIIIQAETALKPHGWLLLEHGYRQAEALQQFANTRGVWRQLATRQDYGGNDRVTLMQRGIAEAHMNITG